MAAHPERSSGQPKPVIGIAGGIGSGKSFIAQAFGALGCGVINSDQAAHRVLNQPEVKEQLRAWWGPEVIGPDGMVNRRKIGQRTFGRPEELVRLNALVHPKVGELRDQEMAGMLADPAVKAIVWDTPLLFEVGLDRQCDAVVFVRAPRELRLERVQRTRSWTAEELEKRENIQIPLDKKEKLSDYIVENAGDAQASFRQVREIFSLILIRTSSSV